MPVNPSTKMAMDYGSGSDFCYHIPVLDPEDPWLEVEDSEAVSHSR
jgi:hypothetical protein